MRWPFGENDGHCHFGSPRSQQNFGISASVFNQSSLSIGVYGDQILKNRDNHKGSYGFT